jgi:hypothetical protein
VHLKVTSSPTWATTIPCTWRHPFRQLRQRVRSKFVDQWVQNLTCQSKQWNWVFSKPVNYYGLRVLTVNAHTLRSASRYITKNPSNFCTSRYVHEQCEA